MDTLGKIFHVDFLEYANWFMSKRIYQMKDHYIYVDQARYETFIVVKYLDTTTVKASNFFYNTTLPFGMIHTKADASINILKCAKAIHAVHAVLYSLSVLDLATGPGTYVPWSIGPPIPSRWLVARSG